MAARALHYQTWCDFYHDPGPALVSSIPIVVSNPTYSVLFSAPFTDLAPGNVLVVLAEFEATNPYSYNAGVFTKVVIGSSASDVSGAIIGADNGTNITPDNHHMAFTKTGMYYCTNTTPAASWFNVCTYATSSSAAGGDMLTIEQSNYGHLMVMRLR